MHKKIQTALVRISKLQDAYKEDFEFKAQFCAASSAIFLKGLSAFKKD